MLHIQKILSECNIRFLFHTFNPLIRVDQPPKISRHYVHTIHMRHEGHSLLREVNVIDGGFRMQYSESVTLSYRISVSQSKNIPWLSLPSHSEQRCLWCGPSCRGLPRAASGCEVGTLCCSRRRAVQEEGVEVCRSPQNSQLSWLSGPSLLLNNRT